MLPMPVAGVVIVVVSALIVIVIAMSNVASWVVIIMSCVVVGRLSEGGAIGGISYVSAIAVVTLIEANPIDSY